MEPENVPTYGLKKSDIRVLLNLNGKLLNIDMIMEKCNFDFIVTRKSLKKLILLKLVDIESYKGRTNFKVTEEGKRIAKEEYEKRKCAGLYGAVYYYKEGELKFHPNKTISYIKSFLDEYNEGEYLIDPHVDFIIKCLEQHQHGQDFLEKGINKVEIIEKGRVYTLRVYMNDCSCKTLPVNRVLGERGKYNHKEDVKKALHNITETEILPDGVCRYHDKPSFGELIKVFFEENKLNYDIIKTKRTNDRIDLEDEDIKEKWLDFYQKNAHYVIITDEERNRLHYQNTVLSKKTDPKEQ